MAAYREWVMKNRHRYGMFVARVQEMQLSIFRAMIKISEDPLNKARHKVIKCCRALGRGEERELD
eukprot:3348798-Alexandrium_andersonii.AAC.1